MSIQCPDQEFLDQIFPAQKADAFFDALYGGAEEGAYDIRLICFGVEPKKAHLAFELNKREGKCLKCSLTYGLPDVFQRHPVLNLQGTANSIAEKLNWKGAIKWHVGSTQEVSDEQHLIPFEIEEE